VSINAYDPQDIAAVTLFWRVDGWNNASMLPRNPQLSISASARPGRGRDGERRIIYRQKE
jgi:hypothetical protein